MLRTTTTHAEFERLVKDYLADNPNVPHHWRIIHGYSGGRTDLVCWPGSERKVFASLTDHQITIGARGVEKDFEHFGRKITDTELATEALAYFVERIRVAIEDHA